jgi:signal transduction histidine kinase
VLSQILNAPVTPPRALDASIPAGLERVVVKLLAKDPAGRYASAQEVLAALPGLEEMESWAEQTSAERASLSLLERIVRSSSNTQLKREPPDKESLLTLTDSAQAARPQQMQELLVYAALEDTVAAVEEERRRLAGLLQGSVVEPLNLLLSQASAYEQTLGANPTARMAVSVLTSLARQVLQQVRDLETNLHPTTLETLGLEPALDVLVSQTMRAHGLHITLALERMRERLPHQVELVLFRATQNALDHAIHHAHASQATIRLERRDEHLIFSLSHNGIAAIDSRSQVSPGTARQGKCGKKPGLSASHQRIEQLGGSVESSVGSPGGFELTISLPIEAPVQLTPREMEVIQLLAEGMKDKEIAQALFISPRTVNFHLDNIYSKLGISSRTEAAIYALRHGWVRAA